MEICIGRILDDFQILLINLKLGTFLALLESRYNLRHVVKPTKKDSWKPKVAGRASTATAKIARKQHGGNDKKRKDREFEPAPDYPCTLEEVKALTAMGVADGEMKLSAIDYEPSRRDHESPKLCIYHHHIRHPTANCWTLKRIFGRKQLANELRMGQRDVHEEPYPPHRNQEVNMAECYPFMYDDKEEDSESWAYTVSCYEITEDFASSPNPAVMPDPNASVKTLQNSTKFRSLFDGFVFTPAARLEMTKAIIKIAEVHQEACMSIEGSVFTNHQR